METDLDLETYLKRVENSNHIKRWNAGLETIKRQQESYNKSRSDRRSHLQKQRSDAKRQKLKLETKITELTYKLATLKSYRSGYFRGRTTYLKNKISTEKLRLKKSLIGYGKIVRAFKKKWSQ